MVNPAKGNVTFNFNLANSQNVQLEVYDVKGNLVKKIANAKYMVGDNNVKLSTDDLPAGLYNCRLMTKDVVLNKKLTIVK